MLLLWQSDCVPDSLSLFLPHRIVGLMTAGTHGAEEVTAEFLFVLCKESGTCVCVCVCVCVCALQGEWYVCVCVCVLCKESGTCVCVCVCVLHVCMCMGIHVHMCKFKRVGTDIT